MDLIKITPDIERVRNILEMIGLIEQRIKTQNKEIMASLIIADYYEIIKELITAVLLTDGFKTLSHKELIEYIKTNYREFSESEISLLDTLRVLRNRISYEGFKINISYLKRNEPEFKSIIQKLKILIKEKIS